jgi:hypothetical protein
MLTKSKILKNFELWSSKVDPINLIQTLAYEVHGVFFANKSKSHYLTCKSLNMENT